MYNKKGYLEKLINALTHPEPVTRVRAAWLLGQKRESSAEIPLINAFKENQDDPYILESIAKALGRIGDRLAIDELAALLKDPYIIVRVQAAGAIGEIGDPGGIEPLKGALKDQNKSVRQAAANALEKIRRRETEIS
jgi:HEAT repeat protein